MWNLEHGRTRFDVIPEQMPLSDTETAALEAFVATVEADIEVFLRHFEPWLAALLKELETKLAPDS